MSEMTKKNSLSRFLPSLRKVKGVFIAFLLISILSGSALTVRHKEVNAFCTNCVSCSLLDTFVTVLILDFIEDDIWQPIIEDNIEDHINDEQKWIVEEFFKDYWVKALEELTQFLDAFGMYQMEMVGAFFDAKNYLETRRLYFKLHAEAHKDYHPSDDFCWFGTNARSLSSSERRAKLNSLAMSKRALVRQLGHKNSASAVGINDDKKARWDQFVKTYCDPKDNEWNQAGTGLDLACDRDATGASTAAGALDSNRVNRDVDYTRLIDEPRTLKVNFSDTVTPVPADEEDVMAMASNLYGHDVFAQRMSLELMEHPAAVKLYMDLRSVAAKRNVAESSFNAIVSMKSEGTNGSPGSLPDVGTFASSIIKDLMPPGTPDSEIYAILGENPSYYAQLEVLGKKIYQNPDFFANLYDKPANVKRKSVAMKAIGLMLDRALFESELRQEMLLSVMLSSQLTSQFGKINTDLKSDQ